MEHSYRINHTMRFMRRLPTNGDSLSECMGGDTTSRERLALISIAMDKYIISGNTDNFNALQSIVKQHAEYLTGTAQTAFLSLYLPQLIANTPLGKAIAPIVNAKVSRDDLLKEFTKSGRYTTEQLQAMTQRHDGDYHAVAKALGVGTIWNSSQYSAFKKYVKGLVKAAPAVHPSVHLGVDSQSRAPLQITEPQMVAVRLQAPQEPSVSGQQLFLQQQAETPTPVM